MDEETRAIAGWVLDQILVMLHPFMPFVTEELWHALAEREHDLILAQWPMPDARAIDQEAIAEIEWLIEAISKVRGARAELNVPAAARLEFFVAGQSDVIGWRLKRNEATLYRLARLQSTNEPITGHGVAQVVVGEATFALQLEGVIDLAAERARLEKSAAAAEKERDALAARLANPAFVERARPEAIEKARADHAGRAAEAERLRAALGRLG